MYRFYLKYSTGGGWIETQFSPLGSDKFMIEQQQEEGEIFYRKSLNNEVVLSRLQDKNLYDTILDYFETSQYSNIYFYIRPECNISKTEFSGVTTFRKTKVDRDVSQITFKFEISDAYRPFIQFKDIEYNILEVSSNRSVRSSIYSYLEFATNDNKPYWWKVAEHSIAILIKVKLYARERVDYPIYDENWTVLKDEEENFYSVRVWTDSYPDLADNIVFEEPNLTTVTIGSVTVYLTKLVEYFVDTQYENWAYVYSLSPTSSYLTNIEYTINYSGFLSMADVLDFFINKINSSVNYDATDFSKFFNDNNSSLSGSEDYAHMSISHKSNILYPGGTNATVGKMTWTQLMDFHKYGMNCWWYIDDSNNFRLEYYGDSPLVTEGIDATLLENENGEKYISGTNNYSFDSENIPLQEKLAFTEAGNEDFIGVPIEYEVNVGNETIKEYIMQSITTDIKYMQTNRNSINIDGFVIVQLEEVGVVSKIYEIKEDTGILSGDTILNANTSTANLMDKFWRIHRQLKYGTMNNQSVVFLSSKKTKKGGDIKFPLCCTNFDPKNLIKSYHGWGEVIKSTLSLKDGWITVSLRFNSESTI